VLVSNPKLAFLSPWSNDAQACLLYLLTHRWKQSFDIVNCSGRDEDYCTCATTNWSGGAAHISQRSFMISVLTDSLTKNLLNSGILQKQWWQKQSFWRANTINIWDLPKLGRSEDTTCEPPDHLSPKTRAPGIPVYATCRCLSTTREYPKPSRPDTMTTFLNVTGQRDDNAVTITVYCFNYWH